MRLLRHSEKVCGKSGRIPKQISHIIAIEKRRRSAKKVKGSVDCKPSFAKIAPLLHIRTKIMETTENLRCFDFDGEVSNLFWLVSILKTLCHLLSRYQQRLNPRSILVFVHENVRMTELIGENVI